MGLPWLSSVVAVVMRADLTHIGDHDGWACMTSAAMPEMCGADIDVPDSALKLLPLGSPAGETAAMTSTPGAVMSGLSRSPPPAIAGPSEGEPAIPGARTGA